MNALRQARSASPSSERRTPGTAAINPDLLNKKGCATLTHEGCVTANLQILAANVHGSHINLNILNGLAASSARSMTRPGARPTRLGSRPDTNGRHPNGGGPGTNGAQTEPPQQVPVATAGSPPSQPSETVSAGRFYKESPTHPGLEPNRPL
jgi:hypothetical protein